MLRTTNRNNEEVCTDSIKEERDSPDMDNIRESFTCDRNDIKENTFDNIDIKDEGASQNLQDISEGCTCECDDIDIKEEGVSQNMDNISEECTCDITERQERDRASGGSEAKGVETTGNLFLTHMQCNVSLCNGDSVRPAGRRGKNFNVGYISLNIRGRLLIFGIHIDHMDLYPPDL